MDCTRRKMSRRSSGDVMVIKSHNRAGEWETWEVSSHSSPDKEYLITLDHEEGTILCDCPDFTYRKSYKKWGGVDIDDDSTHFCKHIKEVLHE